VGLHFPPHTSPRRMAQHIRERLGEPGHAAAQWMLRYEAERYGSQRSTTPRQLWQEWLRAKKSL